MDEGKAAARAMSRGKPLQRKWGEWVEEGIQCLLRLLDRRWKTHFHHRPSVPRFKVITKVNCTKACKKAFIIAAMRDGTFPRPR